MHDETYRMLGREREADLLREANRINRAAEVRRSPAGSRLDALTALVPHLARFFRPRRSDTPAPSRKGATT